MPNNAKCKCVSYPLIGFKVTCIFDVDSNFQNIIFYNSDELIGQVYYHTGNKIGEVYCNINSNIFITKTSFFENSSLESIYFLNIIDKSEYQFWFTEKHNNLAIVSIISPNENHSETYIIMEGVIIKKICSLSEKNCIETKYSLEGVEIR